MELKRNSFVCFFFYLQPSSHHLSSCIFFVSISLLANERSCSFFFQSSSVRVDDNNWRIGATAQILDLVWQMADLCALGTVCQSAQKKSPRRVFLAANPWKKSSLPRIVWPYCSSARRFLFQHVLSYISFLLRAELSDDLYFLPAGEKSLPLDLLGNVIS